MQPQLRSFGPLTTIPLSFFAQSNALLFLTIILFEDSSCSKRLCCRLKIWGSFTNLLRSIIKQRPQFPPKWSFSNPLIITWLASHLIATCSGLLIFIWIFLCFDYDRYVASYLFFVCWTLYGNQWCFCSIMVHPIILLKVRNKELFLAGPPSSVGSESDCESRGR